LAILILSEPAEWVEPAKVAMAPGIGASISALGFGRCAGEAVRAKGRPGSVVAIESEAITIDVPLCKGDVGGPIVDGNGGALVGLISHRDDPEGSPRKTTTAFRLDTTGARSLVQIATDVAKGLDPAKVGPIGCD
jgi:hypothetical protein